MNSRHTGGPVPAPAEAGTRQPVVREKALAVVTRILKVEPHPDPTATRTEVIHVLIPPGLCENCPPPPPGEPQGGRGAAQQLVTGKHYRAGDLGVWLRPGGYIPGWLARSLWMVGKARANAWFEVRSIPIGPPGGTVKVESPGLWCGMYYQTDTSRESHEHYEEMREQGGVEVWRNSAGELWEGLGQRAEFTPWIRWPYWKARWQVGDVLDDHLGVLSFDPRAIRTMIAEVHHSQLLEGDYLPSAGEVSLYREDGTPRTHDEILEAGAQARHRELVDRIGAAKRGDA